VWKTLFHTYTIITTTVQKEHGLGISHDKYHPKINLLDFSLYNEKCGKIDWVIFQINSIHFPSLKIATDI